MSDFLLEIRCEEIPARMQKGARAELEKLFRAQMDAAGVGTGELTIWSTPRRLALIVRDLPLATEPVSEEAKGPPEAAPDQAVDGFCRKNGVTRDQLEVRNVKGRATYFAVKDIPGRAVSELLGEAIPAIIRSFSWPKSQRWGAASISTESLRWVRPLSGIIALFDGEVVPCEVDGIASGRETLGHRFHSSGVITVTNTDDYAEKLRAAHVIVDHEERQNIVRTGADKAAQEAGLKLVEDEGLVVENAGLTEWPVPLLGRFDDDFLDVPPETIQLTARVNQKYFVCEEEDGKLANAFICTANIDAEDPAVVIDGNRKVLAARLSDARFFWEVDRKTPLSEHAKKLERITFHEKLGSVADKVERVAKLARWLVEEGIVKPNSVRPEPVEGPSLTSEDKSGASTSSARTVEELADMAEQAARLCKADLVTEMVGEFPDLQGLMGGYYARAEGMADEVADAIRDHYKPVGQGDDVPTAPVTVAVSLADKLDTLVGFFLIKERPTGSKDPFALRRAMLGILNTILTNDLRVGLSIPFQQAMVQQIVNIAWREAITVDRAFLEIQSHTFAKKLLPDFKSEALRKVDERQVELIKDGLRTAKHLDRFLSDRLKVQQKEAGVRHDLIDAVFALGGEDDLVRLLARVNALQSFVETEDGTNLLAGYKRAANILKKENHSVTPAKAGVHSSGSADGEMDSGLRRNDEILGLSHTPEPAEAALIAALDNAEPQAASAIEAEDFAAAMTALASLRGPIDAFFEEVTVNADDPAIRASRLDLLARFRAAVHNVADFSKIEG